MIRVADIVEQLYVSINEIIRNVDAAPTNQVLQWETWTDEIAHLLEAAQEEGQNDPAVSTEERTCVEFESTSKRHVMETNGLNV